MLVCMGLDGRVVAEQQVGRWVECWEACQVVLDTAGGQATLGHGRVAATSSLSIDVDVDVGCVCVNARGGGCCEPCDVVCMGGVQMSGGCEGVCQVLAPECMWGV